MTSGTGVSQKHIFTITDKPLQLGTFEFLVAGKAS